MSLDDFLDTFNWIDRLEGVFSSFIHANWKGAAKGPAGVGLVAEAARTAVGAGSWTFRIRRDAGWSGADVEALLRHYGIVAWGRRVTGEHFILSVKERQANWAEYLIMRRGMCLDGSLYNPDNARYAQRYAPGDRPPAWADQSGERRDAVGRLIDWL